MPSSEEDELDEFRMESASIFSQDIVMTDWYVISAFPQICQLTYWSLQNSKRQKCFAFLFRILFYG